MGGPYKNPPIIEVVCEFRFESQHSWDLTYPGLLYERLHDTFPKRKTRRRVRGTTTQEAGDVQTEVQVTELAQFLQDDEVAFVQIAPDLLSINHLKPYPEWVKYKPFISQALSAYADVASPAGLRRIGLRYVNQIVIPEWRIELEDFFLFFPHMNPKLTRDINAFVIVTQLNYDEHASALNLRMSSTGEETPNSVLITLDLDYFLSEPLAVSVDEAMGWVEDAHTNVEEIFEACITDRTRALFR